MKPGNQYANKAEKYARYRWNYDPAAIQVILKTAGIHPGSVVADIGSGTGILSRHFVEAAGSVYAVEPSSEMRGWAEKDLGIYPAFKSLPGQAETIPLPDCSVDLITAGQALHWFQPEPARSEFLRILKPGGWLAILRHQGRDVELGQALAAVCRVEYGWQPSSTDGKPPGKPMEFYFGTREYLQLSFPQSQLENWETFLGGMCSDSHAPGEDHPLYKNFEGELRKVFERFSAGGGIEVHYSTELCLGQMRSVTSSAQ